MGEHWFCRGESPDELLQALQQVLARKAWAQQPLPVLAPTPGQLRSGSSPPASSGSQLRAQDVGVAGILRRQEAAQQTRGRSMDEAFTDLKALMDKAKDMLTFAERIRDSMTRESQAVDDAASAEELEVRVTALSSAAWYACFHAYVFAHPVVHVEPGHHKPSHSQVGRCPVPPAAVAPGKHASDFMV